MILRMRVHDAESVDKQTLTPTRVGRPHAPVVPTQVGIHVFKSGSENSCVDASLRHMALEPVSTTSFWFQNIRQFQKPDKPACPLGRLHFLAGLLVCNCFGQRLRGRASVDHAFFPWSLQPDMWSRPPLKASHPRIPGMRDEADRRVAPGSVTG
jgi:hypothetical protein